MSSDDKDFLDLREYLNSRYLEYSVAVAKDRAIPYLSDGLKPVHRRILFAMNELSNFSNSPYKKSARLVGDVIGKYHPHGDTSVYDAMSRLSQPWNMRYPLVDGQGNFGSRDGDGPAAMRYTEARLTPFAEKLLLDELNMGTCDWVNNYDNTIKEPSNFPSKLNLLLLNGTSGIAVGLSTDIPAHNIRELTDATIAAIRNKDITNDEIMDILKGPDFATGGQIIASDEEIKKIYSVGRGVIRVRARWKIEELAKNQWQIVINEFSPTMNAKKILENIDRVINPKTKNDSKGKPKALSQKVIAEKNFLLSVLGSFLDESDKSEAVRLVLTPKNFKQSPEEFMTSIIGMIGLEESVKVNLTTVGLNGSPKTKNIKEILHEWVEYRFDVMTRRCQWRLDKVQSRIHVLEGRVIAFLNIDEVIRIIREADEPKTELMSKLNVSEIQAEDILEIKLRQLANLEKAKIEKEIDTLRKEEKTLQILLGNKTKMFTLMEKEIQEVTALFEDNRRTLIKEDKVAFKSSNDIVQDEAITIIYTKQGWITSRKGHEIELETIQLKTDDEILYVEEGRSVEMVAFLGSDGRGYSVKPSDIPSGKVGFVHINTLITLPQSVTLINMIFANDNKKLLVSNNDGYGYLTSSMNLVSKNKAGKNFMSLPEENSLVFKPILLNESSALVSIQTTDLRLLTFNLNELKELDKGKGFQLIKLADDQKIKKLVVTSIEGFELKIKNKTYLMTADKLSEFIGKRGLRGKKIESNMELI
jgi:topoisomerase-4 subunit A